jgi:RimJ/RimL family protein N-acetyltransferase
VWPHVGDDFTPCAHAWRPEIAPYHLYLLCKDAEEILGVWLFEIRGACWEVHIALLPAAWGARAKRAWREMLAWLWTHTPCRRLIANVPGYNRVALRYAERVGLRRFAVNERSYMRDGALHDQILFGLSRPE